MELDVAGELVKAVSPLLEPAVLYVACDLDSYNAGFPRLRRSDQAVVVRCDLVYLVEEAKQLASRLHDGQTMKSEPELVGLPIAKYLVALE